MDSVALLETARSAGLEVTTDGDKLIVRGPRSAETLAQQLLEHKPAIMALLLSDSEPVYPITLVWPADLQGVGVMEGQWRRLETGEIEATYPDRESLAWAIAPVLPTYDGDPVWAHKWAEAVRRWPDHPPPMTPHRSFGTGEHLRFWRRMDKWDSGWVCATCHPPPPDVEVETWEVPA